MINSLFYFILKNAFDEALTLIVIVIGIIFLIVAVIYNSYDKSKKEGEVKRWEDSANGKETLAIPKLFHSALQEFEYQIPKCTKCGSTNFQIWDKELMSLTVRCISCNKKTTHAIDDNINEKLNNYVQYIVTAYSHEHELLRQKMQTLIKYNFSGLRKGTPYYRAITFQAKRVNEEINKVKIDDKDSRRIPQRVKDKVWNRDGGKCVECGSNKLLEFDHIIPHSKGGANTYRNIQLLCESCNRIKSNKIG